MLQNDCTLDIADMKYYSVIDMVATEAVVSGNYNAPGFQTELVSADFHMPVS